jgi:hypothetical protein
MMHDLVTALLPAIPYLAVLLVGFVLFVIVFLFRAFKNEPEKTRVAVMLEIASLRKLRQVFTRKTDLVVTGEGEIIRPNFGETISRPIDAVKPPEQKP